MDRISSDSIDDETSTGHTLWMPLGAECTSLRDQSHMDAEQDHLPSVSATPCDAGRGLRNNATCTSALTEQQQRRQRRLFTDEQQLGNHHHDQSSMDSGPDYSPTNPTTTSCIGGGGQRDSTPSASTLTSERQQPQQQQRQQQFTDGQSSGDQYRQGSKLSPKNSWIHRFWLWEAMSLVGATGALATIVIVLVQHGNRPLPKWPWMISINTFIAIFSAVFKTCLIMPTAEGIGQLKWLWFRKSRPLNHMEQWDLASRGDTFYFQIITSYCITRLFTDKFYP